MVDKEDEETTGYKTVVGETIGITYSSSRVEQFKWDNNEISTVGSKKRNLKKIRESIVTVSESRCQVVTFWQLPSIWMPFK